MNEQIQILEAIGWFDTNVQTIFNFGLFHITLTAFLLGNIFSHLTLMLMIKKIIKQTIDENGSYQKEEIKEDRKSESKECDTNNN